MTRAARLPTGRQLVLTWSIPADYGGLTAALLQRSRLFDRRGGAAVDVLTCDDREDHARVAAELARRDALSERVRVVNLWDWLRTDTLRGRAVSPADGFAPLASGDEGVVEDRSGGHVVRRVRRDAAGAVQQIDHLRPDGSLAASDRRDVPRADGRVRRRVVTCDTDGAPLAAFSGVRAVYTAWLDRVTGGEPSFLLVDSKTMARFATTYRRRHVVVLHIVHGSHLTDEGDAVRPSRAEVFGKLAAFDAVVFCTDRQAQDARRMAGRLPLLLTVPHPVRVREVDTTAPREGVAVVARLEPIKRVEDALAAVRRARTEEPGLTLDVYGDGPAGDTLRAIAGEDGGIRFHGFDPNAGAALRERSVLLLTSKSEAFSLVIAEAMAAGCLPIAYDVPYGPRELILDGRTGWLVPSGDVAALTDAVVRAVRLTPEETARMRRAAVERARLYDEDAVLARWAGALERASRRQRLRRQAWRVREVLRRRLGVR